MPVAVAPAVPAGGAATLEISGTVRLKRETMLGFSTPGRVAAILVREGDSVRAGQLLARLDLTSLDAASASSQAEYVRAEADYRRLLGLFEKGWVTAPRVETARATMAAAQARRRQAGFDETLGSVRAPSAGVVLQRPAEPGQIVAAGQTILTLGEAASGHVLRLPMADGDVARIRLGQPAQVLRPALGPAPLPATVSEIGARGDEATGTFRVELSLPPRPGLRSGLIGSARLALAGTGPSALGVPASAVFSARADEGFVYVHDAAAGRVRLRRVSIGPVGDTQILVLSGLKAGEQVVSSGPDRLRDGMRVQVRRG